MDIVCDTNVWYKVALEGYDLTQRKGAGERFLVTPFSIIELIAGINRRNFSQRRAVLNAALVQCNGFLNLPSTHFAGQWGFAVSPDGYKAEAVAARVVDSNSYLELLCRSRSIVAKCRRDKDAAYASMVDLVNKAIDVIKPGYAAARNAKKMVHLEQYLWPKLRNALSNGYVKERLVRATYDKACAGAGIAPASVPSSLQVSSAKKGLEIYIDVYSEFIYDAATNKPAEPNDTGDLECFIYAQGGRAVLTEEVRWNRLATAAGHAAAMSSF